MVGERGEPGARVGRDPLLGGRAAERARSRERPAGRGCEQALGQAELVGALDDQRVRLWDVESGLDDRRRDQAVGVAAQEAGIAASGSDSSILPCASAKRTPGSSAPQALGDLGQRLDPVVQEERLASRAASRAIARLTSCSS